MTSNEQTVVEKHDGFACGLTPEQSSAVAYLEIDFNGQNEKLRAFLSHPELQGRYENFAIVAYRPNPDKTYLYGISPKASRALHAFLQAPGVANKKSKMNICSQLGDRLDRVYNDLSTMNLAPSA